MVMESTNFMTDLFKQSSEMFNQSFCAGMKLQEDAARFWTNTLGKNLEQVCNQTEKFSQESMPAAKKNLQNFRNLCDEQGQRGMDMFRKSFESAEATLNDNVMDKTMDFWRTSFDAVRTGFDTMTKSNVQMMDRWADAAHKCCETSAPKNQPKSNPKS